MKVLICGFGSVGARHFKNLIKLGYKDILIVTKKKIKLKYKGVKIFKKLTDALKCGPLFSIISNPTSMHTHTALLCAKYGCHLLIEKPVCSNLHYSRKLINIINKKKLINMVGYMLRFHPGIKLVKNILKKNFLGKIYFVRSFWGEYLPNWHPNEDYKKSYASLKRLGGGVSLTLSHDLDLMKFFFDQPLELHNINSKNFLLKSKTDTNSDFIIKFRNNIHCSVHLDYLTRETERSLEIYGVKGKLDFNFIKNEIKIKKNNKEKKIKFSNFNRNKLFIDELKYFINCIKNNSTAVPSVKESFDLIRQFKISY